MQADSENDKLRLYLREAGTSTLLDKASVTIAEGTEYQLAIVLRKTQVKAALYSAHGRFIAETDEISDNTFDSGTFGFYTGGSGAPAYYDSVQEAPITVESLTEPSTSHAVANDALNSTVGQKVLAELNDPATDTSNATRANLYPTGQRFAAHLIRVPIEYGDLIVEYNDGTATVASAHLDRSTMPSSLIGDLSDDFGWPDTENGFVFYSENASEPKFVRSTTDSEENDVTALVTEKEGRDDQPDDIVVRNNDGGNYESLYYDTVYEVNEARDTITGESDRYGSPPCQNLKKRCNGQRLFTGLSTAQSVALCAAALAEPTPVGEIVCAHELAVMGITTAATSTSGPCKRYNQKCK